MKIPSSARSAFSLVEILVVIAIIGIIASFAIPHVSSMVRGTEVTRAAQMVSDEFTKARQMAISGNKQIELRIIRFADPEQPGEKLDDETTWKVRGLQLMEVTTSGSPVQIGAMIRLPGQMLIDDGKYSTLIAPSGSSPMQEALRFNRPTELDPPMPRVAAEKARNYAYASFRFLPDGSTNLAATGKWYLTVVSALDLPRLRDDTIKTINYFIIQIDPVSGVTRNYRPSLG